MSDRNVQSAISDLAALKPNWTLLADTLPAEFLQQVKGEIESLTAQRDGYLETIHETFRVLESRGQAPDDNAPLSVTVRRVLDALDRVTTERDALAAELAALKNAVEQAECALMEIGECSCNIGTDVERVVHAYRCALLRLEGSET